MWISQENENSQRQNHHQSPSQTGTKKTRRIACTFPKSARLLKRSDFLKTSRQGSRFFGAVLTLDYRFGHSLSPRLGISVSRRYGNSVKRNRFKRCLREAFRAFQHHMPENVEINVSPKGFSPDITPEVCLCDLKRFLSSIQKPSSPIKNCGAPTTLA